MVLLMKPQQLLDTIQKPMKTFTRISHSKNPLPNTNLLKEDRLLSQQSKRFDLIKKTNSKIRKRLLKRQQFQKIKDS